MNFLEHVEFDEHEQVEFCHDEETGLRAIIAIHNTRLGPGTGGCRMYPYANPELALTDALRLSKGMTYKSAMAGLPFGGGKSVIIGDPRRDKNDDMMRAFGRFVDSLAGKYVAAEDSGTTVQDMQTIQQVTTHVSGATQGHSHAGDPSPYTAYGIFMGIKAAVKHKLGRDELTGLKVAIQGVGNVGYHLAKHLKEAGATLFVCDVYPENLKRALDDLGCYAVLPKDIYSADVDVFAPCAMGGILNDQTIPTIKANIVAGGANNQLARPEHGQMLFDKGITYAPDYVINAGGIIDIAYQQNGGSEEAKMQHIEKIAATLGEIFAESDKLKTSAQEVADQIARSKLN